MRRRPVPDLALDEKTERFLVHGGLPGTSAATAPAQDAWMPWRRFIPADNPEANDGRLWRVQPGTKTKADCESEMKEYRVLDPNKVLLDPAGRGYRIEYHCSRMLRTRAYRRRSE